MDQQPTEADLDRLATEVGQRFSDLRPLRPLRVLGSGFRSVVLETAGGVALKVGRSPEAPADYAKEWRIGGFLAGRLGSVVPEPRWYAEPCEEFPYGAVGYMKLPGETPAWGSDPGRTFARDLGAFMARLHAIPVADAEAAGVPVVDAYRRALGARDVVMPLLAARLTAHDCQRVEAWWASFAGDGRMRARRQCVCHHDLWHANLLRSPAGQLSGVLDIAHIEISDPAHDFSAPRYFGDDFMTQLVASYTAADGTFKADDDYRSRRFFEAREFGGLAWAIEHHDADEVDAAVHKITGGPIFTGS